MVARHDGQPRTRITRRQQKPGRPQTGFLPLLDGDGDRRDLKALDCHRKWAKVGGQGAPPENDSTGLGPRTEGGFFLRTSASAMP